MVALLMRLLSIIFTFLTCTQALAEECGLYKVDDFGDRFVNSLLDFETLRPLTVHYFIVNSQSDEVRKMVPRLCYCVKGGTVQNPLYKDDLNYLLLTVDSVTRGPKNFAPCVPQPSPRKFDEQLTTDL